MKLKFNIQSNIKKQKTEDHLKMVLFKCMIKMQELATLNCPVDTGRLRNSILIKPVNPGYSNYILRDGVTYGINVEYGTSPHHVSAKHLKGWARRVLKSESLAYPVAKKIAVKGTEAQPFFRPALDQVKNIWIRRYFKSVFKEVPLK
jgi:HK97 gp10 family phage protein